MLQQQFVFIPAVAWKDAPSTAATILFRKVPFSHLLGKLHLLELWSLVNSTQTKSTCFSKKTAAAVKRGKNTRTIRGEKNLSVDWTIDCQYPL